MVRMGGVVPAAFQAARSVLSNNRDDTLFGIDTRADTSIDSADIFTFNWKDVADARLSDREQLLVEEESKRFVNVILRNWHSLCQYIAIEVWPYVDFDVLLGEPIIANHFFVVFIIIFYSRLSPELLYLIISFQYCVNPLYVVLFGGAIKLFLSGPRTPKNYIPQSNRHNNDLSKLADIPGVESRAFAADTIETLNYETLAAMCETLNAAKYDHILVGGDLSTLYTAALLAKCGHRCCVLRIRTGPQLKLSIPRISVPVCVVDPHVSRLSQYQTMLDVVIPQNVPEKRVLFEHVGSASSGHLHTVVRCDLQQSTHAAADDPMGSNGASIPPAIYTVDFGFRAGQSSLLEDLNDIFNMDDNIASRILSPLVFLCELMSMYLSTKVGFFTLKTDKQSATAKTLLSNIKQCVELSALNTKSYFANFVKNIPDLQGSISRDFDAISAVLSSPVGWDLPCSTDVSMLHIGSTLAPMLNQGCYVPSGGVDALYSMLTTTIVESGGMICDSFEDIEGFVVEEASYPAPLLESGGRTSAVKKTRVMGVLIKCGANALILRPRHSVISGLGAIATYKNVTLAAAKEGGNPGQKVVHFSHIIPSIIEEALAKVQEVPPRVLCIFEISEKCLLKNNNDFNCCIASNYFKTTHLDKGGMYNQSGTREILTDRALVVNGSYKVWCPSARDRNRSDGVIFVVEFVAGDELVSQNKSNIVNESSVYALNSGITVNHRVGKMGSYMTFSSDLTSRLHDVSWPILQDLYPFIDEKDIIGFNTVLTPLGGHALAGLPSKYVADLKSQTPFEGLYLCGGDVSTAGFAGDIQGGWVAANAVLGYRIDELLMQHSVTTDLRRL